MRGVFLFYENKIAILLIFLCIYNIMHLVLLYKEENYDYRQTTKSSLERLFYKTWF